MGDLSDFETEQIVRCAFSWSICDKNCHIIRCIERDSFQGYVGIHESSEDNSSEEEYGRKSTLTKRDRRTWRRIFFEKSQNCCSTCDRTTELNIRLEDPVSTKTVKRELHKSSIRGMAAIAKPLITESNAQMRKRLCHDH
jgi:hypothetical protein